MMDNIKKIAMQSILLGMLTLGLAKSPRPSITIERPVYHLEKRDLTTSIVAAIVTITTSVPNGPSYAAAGQNGISLVSDKSLAATFTLQDQQLYANGMYFGAVPAQVVAASQSYPLSGAANGAGIIARTWAVSDNSFTYFGPQLSQISGFCVATSSIYLRGTGAPTQAACPPITLIASVMATTITTRIPYNSVAYTSTNVGSGTITDTVVIGQPYSTLSTFTTTLIGSYASLTTTTMSQVGNTGPTVEVLIPATTTTITSIGTSAYTSTITQSNVSPGTVMVVFLASTVSTTTIGNYLALSTTTIVQQALAPATIAVFIPATTVTTTSIGSSGYTSTRSQTDVVPGTIVFAYPASTLTTTTIGAFSRLSTTTINQTGTMPGTIEVLIPATTITTTTFGATLSPTTSTTSQVDTTPGTVLFQFSATTRTSTEFVPGYVGVQTQRQVGTTPGLVIYYVSASTTTTTTYGTFATQTSTTIRQQGGNPATLIVEFPASTTTITTYTQGGVYTTSTFSQQGSTPGTVLFQFSATTRTSTEFLQGYMGTRTTSQVATIPGSVIVYAGPTTTTTTTIGTFTAPTSTIVRQAGTNPATLIVQIPSSTVTSTTVGAYIGISITIVSQMGTTPATAVVEIAASTITTTTTVSPGFTSFQSTTTQVYTTPGVVVVGVCLPNVYRLRASAPGASFDNTFLTRPNYDPDGIAFDGTTDNAYIFYLEAGTNYVYLYEDGLKKYLQVYQADDDIFVFRFVYGVTGYDPLYYLVCNTAGPSGGAFTCTAGPKDTFTYEPYGQDFLAFREPNYRSQFNPDPAINLNAEPACP